MDRPPTLPNRRQALRYIAGAAALTRLRFAYAAAPAPSALTPAQDAFLDDLSHRACQFFFDHASPKNGQVRDRARAEGKENRRIASVAATGFGLTALCIADRRAWRPTSDIRARVHATLDFHLHKQLHEHGFFYHFTDLETGERLWKCEISSIDTALLLCGALTCRAHFTGPGIERDIRDMASALYDRVDWPWMLTGGLTGGQPGALTYSMGWKPESGFIASRWSHYCELMMLYLLGIGSNTHPADPKSWEAFARPYVSYEGFHYISGTDPLFTHQFSHAWFDFRSKHDRYADYFANSILATRAHKAFCLSRGAPYSDTYWGITASDSQAGYQAWGGPPALGKIDGSVVPCAPAGSLPFMPDDCLTDLMALQQNFPKAWTRYGFVDAFNARDNWFNPDVLGIDQGIGLLMAENLRSSFVWDTFMKNAEVRKAMDLAGFVPNTSR